jgi:membrane protein required for colicin V production
LQFQPFLLTIHHLNTVRVWETVHFEKKGVIMGAGVGLTGYDLVVIGLFALMVIRGVWLGFLKQITVLLALYLGYIVAGQYHDRIFPFLREVSKNPKVVFFAAYAILFIATYVAVMLAGKGLAYVMQLTITSWFDKMLGGILGGAKALILIILIHMILTMAVPPENTSFSTCRTCNALTKTVNFSRDLIKDEDVRKALMQQKPAISAQDVKEFFESPPKEKASADKSLPDKPPADKAAPEKAPPEIETPEKSMPDKSPPVQ